MKAVLSRLRRLGASCMLVAMASFILHGAAMAGFHAHGAGSPQCQPQAAHVHQHATSHDHAGHQHADGVVHVHTTESAQVAAEHPGAGPQHDTADSQLPCCSTACGVTLTAGDMPAVAGPPPVASVILPASQDGCGTDPNGLKRPPRTPSIA